MHLLVNSFCPMIDSLFISMYVTQQFSPFLEWKGEKFGLNMKKSVDLRINAKVICLLNHGKNRQYF